MTEHVSLSLPLGVDAQERALRGLRAAVPFLVAGLVTGIVAADRGGYWPASWGWSGLVLAWVGAVGLALRPGHVSRLELAFVGALAAFAGWTALSLLWTSSGTQTVLSLERILVYVLAVIAVVGVVGSASYAPLLWGVWAGAGTACLYGLATRLFPERIGEFDPLAANRLEAPVGYWNGLGLLAAMAIILAVGLAARGGPLLGRALAAASLPLLLPTLYLTFSRGAWLALAAGLVAAVALAPWRLELVVATLIQGAIAGYAVWLVERAPAMHAAVSNLTDQVAEGHRLAWQLPVVSLLAASAAAVVGIVARRLRVPRSVHRGFAWLLVGALVACFAAGVVHYGGPSGAWHRLHHSLEGHASQEADLNRRLFTLSNERRLRQWDVALDEWRAHRAVGGGAGTYAQYWAAEASEEGQTLNAHNLYLETLAELGPIGLALLVVGLALPLVAAFKARSRPLVAIAAGVWVAYLFHAAYDWDWQLAGVTLVGIFCASAILVAARRRDAELTSSRWARGALLAGAVAGGLLAFFGLLGNRALDRSGNALRAGNVAAAVTAAEDAHRWAPWSSQPWAQLAAIENTQGHGAAARNAYRHAVEVDPRDWELWLAYAQVATGVERRRALARLVALDSSAADVLGAASP